MDGLSDSLVSKYSDHLEGLNSISGKLDYLKSVAESTELMESLAEGQIVTLFDFVQEYQANHFFDVKNIEFTYWFLRYNAKRWFDTEMEHDKVVLKLNSKERINNIVGVLRKIKKEIGSARKLEKKGVIKPFEPYKSKKGYMYVGDTDNFTDPMNEKVSIPIFNEINISNVEVIRVLEDYYESYATEHSYTTLCSPEVKAYSRYVLVKEHFLNLLNNIDITDKQDKIEIGTLKNQHPNIFSGNSFHIWSQMFKDFDIRESSRMDLRFMIDKMKEERLMHRGITQKAILDWVNDTYEMAFERLPSKDFSKDSTRQAIFEKAKL